MKRDSEKYREIDRQTHIDRQLEALVWIFFWILPLLYLAAVWKPLERIQALASMPLACEGLAAEIRRLPEDSVASSSWRPQCPSGCFDKLGVHSLSVLMMRALGSLLGHLIFGNFQVAEYTVIRPQILARVDLGSLMPCFCGHLDPQGQTGQSQ